MKHKSKTLIIILFFILSSFLSIKVSAHSEEQVGLLINGIETNAYHIEGSILPSFKIPTTKAPENYLVAQKLEFVVTTEINPAGFSTNPDLTWDFGDNSEPKKGLDISHSYTKPGSYFLTIHIRDNPSADTELLARALINILPSADYKLPEAKITVDSKSINDPQKDSLKLNLKENFLFFSRNKELTFDGSKTTSSAKIVEYFWDFDDGSWGKDKTARHTYEKDYFYFNPILRVKDENGFISDTTIRLENQTKVTGSKEATKISKTALFLLPILIILGVIIIVTLKRKGFKKEL